jgi:glycosyltransferase involved in cell wall biosynthesis
MDVVERIHLVLSECGAPATGSHRAIWELATRLPDERYDVRVWLTETPANRELATELLSRGITVDPLPRVGSRWDLKGRIDLWSRVRRDRPGLLHLHRAGAAGDAFAAALIDLAAPSNLVVTDHSIPDPAFGASGPSGVHGRADLVTIASLGQLEETVHAHAIPRDRVRIVRGGIDRPDDDAESRRAQRWRERLAAGALRPLWVCLGRIEEGKGHATLIEALATLRRRGLSFSAAIAGAGGLATALEERAQRLGIADSTRFVGPIEDPGGLLLAADVVIVPTLEDRAPGVLVEAMARGRVVVATATLGIAEAVENGRDGILVPPGDAEALAQALEMLARKPDLSTRLGAAAVRRIEAERSWSSIVEEYEAVYDEALGFATFVPALEREARAHR